VRGSFSFLRAQQEERMVNHGEQPGPSPARIAFCITDLDAGGAERAFVQIVTRLDRRRFEPFVFCLSGEGELAAPLRKAGITVACLGVKKWHDVGVIWRLSRRLAALRPAILQTFLYHANIVGRLAGKIARVPRIVSGIRVAEKRGRLRLWVDRATDWMVDAHVCVSQDVAAFSVGTGRLPASKIHVIPNGVDAEQFGHAEPADLGQFGIPKGCRTLLFVGRLDPQKGPFVLLSAAKGLFSTHPDLHLLLVGAGILEEKMRVWIRNERLESRIHFAGRRYDVPAILRAADLLVLPSLWEGLPNVVLEAMAAGTPVIASRVEGISDLIANDETGQVVTPNSPTELQAAIASLLADRERTKRMAHKAQVYISAKFTWCRIVENYADLYGNLLES
jgi:glycosyltransferase involved in cell wall biosynthesis